MVVVTDRIDLEEQLSRNFISGGAFGSAIATKKEGERSKVTSGRELARRISQGSERILFTLVHKFNTASKLADCRNDSPNLIVLVDEGHRSHGGETHERMRRALPRASYIAFTGTPLLKKEKTANKFGPIVHAYTMQRAVEDETVVPLLYEERVPELEINEAAVDRWFEKITLGLSQAQKADLKKKYARKGAVYGAANRIELIAWDIATHFSENIKKLLPGLKGQLATDSKLSAIRYKLALDETGLVTSAVVFVPATEGKKLAVGMRAQMLPLIFKEQQYGRIEGVVSHISTVAADEDVLLRVFKNQKLVRKLFESEAPYKVLINVSVDTRGRSGLAWTSSRGPDRLMDPGTIVSGWVAYDEPRLLYLLLPAVKRLSESAWINALETLEDKLPKSRTDKQ